MVGPLFPVFIYLNSQYTGLKGQVLSIFCFVNRDTLCSRDFNFVLRLLFKISVLVFEIWRGSLVLGLSFRNTRLKDVILPSIFIRLDSLKWGYSNDSNCRGRMTYTLSLNLIYSTINKDDSRYKFNWNQLRSCSGVVNPLNPNIPNCDPPQVKTVIHPIHSGQPGCQEWKWVNLT